MYACGEGSYGRLGQGNSDDLRSLTALSALQGYVLFSGAQLAIQWHHSGVGINDAMGCLLVSRLHVGRLPRINSFN